MKKLITLFALVAFAFAVQASDCSKCPAGKEKKDKTEGKCPAGGDKEKKDKA